MHRLDSIDGEQNRNIHRTVRPRALFRPLGLAITAIGIAAFVVSVFFAWQLTGPQRRALKPIPSDFGYPVESTTFNATDDITIAGWFVPYENSSRGVVLLHGNGSTRSQMIARAKFLRAHGYAVLLYDARGHGESAGNLVSVGWYETKDLLGALAFLRSKGCTEIGCIGASQGGATIALAAPDLHDVKWVVLEGVYPTIRIALDRRFRHTLFLPGWLAGLFMIPIAEWRLGVSLDEIAPVKTIGKLSCPVLVMGGESDLHTTRDDTLELYNAAQAPKMLWLVPNAPHKDLYGFAHEEYEKHLLDFIQTK